MDQLISPSLNPLGVSFAGAPKLLANSDRATGFYAAELDGLRCLAVGAVMIEHFSPTLDRYVAWGNIGVRLFFVLSGFLITQLLLRAREKIADGEAAPSHVLRQFFVRRIFRLWPLYFACLAGAYALNVEMTRQTILWHLCFATNQYVFQNQTWLGVLSHFWTLAVEQQFYLFWPFAILLFPRRWLPTVLTLALLIGSGTRELILFFHLSGPHVIYTPLPCCLDFFAAGALIAFGQKKGLFIGFSQQIILRVLIFAVAGWIVLGSYLKTAECLPAHWPVYDPLLQAVGFAALIVYLLQNPSGFAARCLRCPPLVYLGQISYGIYIFHNFMHRLGPAILRRLIGVNYFSSEAAHVLYLSTLSVIVAVVSYHLFENPVRHIGQRLSR